MQRRACLFGLGGAALTLAGGAAVADSSGPQLASYYDRHMALIDGRAWGWTDRGQPVAMRTGVQQVGVSQDAHWGLLQDGRLLRWGDSADTASVLMAGVTAFACGQSGWFAIDAARDLWHGGGPLQAPRRVARDVVDACIGDGADYHVRRDGTLWVRGLAHRGQYGDGRLTAAADFVQTAADAVAVRAHTGHALYLSRSGVVMGTGGNRYGPLGAHGLGDKADAWGRVFEGAKAIATGSRHSAAIAADGSLWAWGGGFGIQPRRLADQVLTVAAGNTATVALRADGGLLQWDDSAGPRRLRVA